MTLAPSTFEQIKAAIALHPGVCSVAADEAPASLRVVATTASRQWALRVVPDLTGGLPDIRLLDPSLIGLLAHVNHEGTVCVTDHEGLSIDTTRPGAVATYLLSQVLAELEKSLQQHRVGNYTALLDEFEGYWCSLPRARAVDMHLVADDQMREISAFIDAERECVAFTERGQLKQHPYAGLRRFIRFTRERALYVPLAQAVLPPGPSQSLTSERVRQWVFDSLNTPSRAGLEKLLKSWSGRIGAAYLLLSQPRSSGPRAAFGVQFTGRGGRHPLLEPSARWKLCPLFVRRQAAQDLRARGGASDALSQRHVAVIGCGAVGSRIAEHLALAGIGRLSLIDPDRLEPSNLYRHVLGGEWCGATKCAALKAHLEHRLPQLVIHAEPKRLAEWATPATFADVDGIVLAIGKPHVERAFIRQVHAGSAFRGAIVTTWLEPLGLGGHAQRTQPGKPGCLECLYTDPAGASRLAPRVAFARPDQALSRNLTGCVGAFTPYSALDATQTALLATRLLTDGLSGDETSTYASWQGSDREFIAAGFTTTPWYQSLDEARLRAATQEYSRVRCAVCGGTA